MNSTQVVELLARREGWQKRMHGFYSKNSNLMDVRNLKDLPPYLSSLDALQPVLATLSDEEWKLVASYAMPPADVSALPWANFRKGATIKPELLATCIAKAIEKPAEPSPNDHANAD